MGWKGTIRSVGAAVRAAERDAKRRQKELDRQYKQYEKMQELEQAKYEVEVYENHIDVIQSMHKECSKPVDWNTIAESKQPLKPENKKENEKKAQLEADRYKPGLVDRLFWRVEKKRACFAENVLRAVEADNSEFRENIACWEEKVEYWKKSVDIANALLEGTGKAKIEAVEYIQPFSEISNLGSRLSIAVNEDNNLEVTIHVHSADIVPSEMKSLLKNGKLSVKKMPKGKFNEIYQDYVCSCTLRIANEIFSVIPDKVVAVTAVDELLNSKTGHLEESPILSAVISCSTLESLNLETIDPSDSMSNFIHNMSFKKTKGFEAVPRVNIEVLERV
ncbi:hypothetical protein [Thalassomonas sp. RHCl1]|uniref:hypothetical protein n=1 Tax=Thalassomonas sp. RHCl1 TaxID=2995320 RepID=UPI00248CBB4F|nr:hypothetical protein [Thalassomonas sp. RHCl1]